jgi:hypothetical protein
MTRARHVAAFALCLAAVPAAAQNCAGFSDVAVTDPYCPAVEWLRNRAITTGCGTGTAYCPGSEVSRAAMALFMNRLGTALTPRITFVEDAFGMVDPDVAPVLCPTALTAAASYPRQALVSVAFGGAAAGDLGFSARPVVSTDNGVSWQPLGAVSIRDSIAGAAWGNASVAGTVQIPALQAVRFALRVARESGTADFTQARCQLAASVMNANGTSSPF